MTEEKMVDLDTTGESQEVELQEEESTKDVITAPSTLYVTVGFAGKNTFVVSIVLNLIVAVLFKLPS